MTNLAEDTSVKLTKCDIRMHLLEHENVPTFFKQPHLCQKFKLLFEVFDYAQGETVSRKITCNHDNKSCKLYVHCILMYTAKIVSRDYTRGRALQYRCRAGTVRPKRDCLLVLHNFFRNGSAGQDFFFKGHSQNMTVCL